MCVVGGGRKMMYKCLVELDSPVLRFKKSGDILYVISGKELIKANGNTGEILQRAAIFEKDNRTRDFVIDGDTIYCRDFCRLY